MSQISFHRSLYEPEAVARVVSLYGDLASFEVREGADEVFVTIRSVEPEVAGELVDAFKNHVLYETIQQARSSEEVQ